MSDRRHERTGTRPGRPRWAATWARASCWPTRLPRRPGRRGRGHPGGPRGGRGGRAWPPTPPGRAGAGAPAGGRRRRTPGAPASSATGTASCTPPRSVGWPARPRCSSSRTTTSAPASPTRSRWPRWPAAWPRALGLNIALTEAIALGHDCGHGPGGHASEDALSPYVAEGYDHAVWGADVVLAPLNLCAETLDGIRNHSWSRPAPQHPRGRGGVVGRPHRLRLPRLRGRGLGRHRHAGDAPDVGHRAGRGAAAATSWGRSSTPWSTAATSSGSVGHDRGDGRGAGRVPPVQLRARLPAPGLGGPGRERHRGAPGAGRALRRPARTCSPPIARAGSRPGARPRCGPRSPTSAGMTDRFACRAGGRPARLGPGEAASRAWTRVPSGRR